MTELSGGSHCTPFEGETKSGTVGLLLSNLECKVSAPVSIVVLQPPRNRMVSQLCVLHLSVFSLTKSTAEAFVVPSSVLSVKRYDRR